MLLSLLFACGAPEAPTVPVPTASSVPKDVAPAPSKSPASACDLLSPAVIADGFGVSEGSITQGTEEVHKRRHLCSWTWDGGRVDVQRSEAPPSHVNGWAPRMVQAKLAAGLEPEAGLGATSAYSKKDHQMFWQNDDRWLLHVSAGGARPGAVIPHETLRRLADAVQERAQ